MSKVSPVVSQTICSSWCMGTDRDSVTKKPKDKRTGTIKTLRTTEMMEKRKPEWINVGSRERG